MTSASNDRRLRLSDARNRGSQETVERPSAREGVHTWRIFKRKEIISDHDCRTTIGSFSLDARTRIQCGHRREPASSRRLMCEPETPERPALQEIFE